MSDVIGRKPSPRILVCGFTEEVVNAVSAIAPTVAAIDHPGVVRQEEWDLLVTNDTVPRDLSPTLQVLAVGVDDHGFPDDTTGMQSSRSWIARNRTSLATEFVVEPDLPSALDSLVRRSLVSLAQHLAETKTLTIVHEEWHLMAGGVLHSQFGPTPTAVQPFLKTTEGYAIAGRFERRGGAAECWSLPSGADSVEWTRVMLDFLSDRDPVHFPRAADWTLDQRWWTETERASQDRLRAVSEEQDAAIATAERLVGEAGEAAAQATRQAIIGERRMLTGQGDDLVETVIQALESFGFFVEARDEEAAEGDKLEDLRVRDPDAPDWVSIAEVRGYRKGAVLADLNRLHARYRLRFTQESGHEPDAMWYIAHHSFASDPAGRHPALGSHPAEVDLFAEDGGLIIESQYLYDLWMQVRAGEVAPEEARRRLRQATGRFNSDGSST